jgi:hypothetical protein
VLSCMQTRGPRATERSMGGPRLVCPGQLSKVKDRGQRMAIGELPQYVHVVRTGALEQVAVEEVHAEDLIVFDDKLLRVVQPYHATGYLKDMGFRDVELRCIWDDEKSIWGSQHKSYYFAFGERVLRVVG